MVVEEHTSGFRTCQPMYLFDDPCSECLLVELPTVRKDTNVVSRCTCAHSGTR